MNGFELKRRFVHLLPAERELWSRFFEKWGKGWSDYEYDVHVGEGIEAPEDYPDWGRSMVRLLTQKRIDVVAWRQGVPWIFEVKPQAGLSAYGQLLAYRELYRRHFNYWGPIELAIVTDRLNPDEEYLYRGAGINIFLV